MYCKDCIQQIRPVIDHARRLGGKDSFFGFNNKDLPRELGIYRKLKTNYIDEVIYDVNYPNFIKWYEKVSPQGEVSIVKCEVCQKDIENSIKNKFDKSGFSCYVCSLKCRQTMVNKVITENKKKKRQNHFDNLKSKSQAKNGDQIQKESNFDEDLDTDEEYV